MNWKRYRGYRVDFNSFWLQTFCILCGLAFFLRTVYYFMFTNHADLSTAAIIFSMILPLLVTGAVLVVLKFLRLNVPNVVGILGALLCLLLMCGSFFTGDVLRIILAVVVYGGGGALLFATVYGFVPTRQFVMILFGIVLAVRILFYAPGMNLLAWILEVSELSIILSLVLLPATMRPVKLK